PSITPPTTRGICMCTCVEKLGCDANSAQVLMTRIKNHYSFNFPYHYSYLDGSEYPRT
ncbi:13893_t:CDS:1, partial [Entrophospora sp. SA101]